MSDEPWIWLFSDDDMMSPDAVERFLAALKQSGDNACLWRFNVVAVDENDNRLSQHWSTYPEHEGWREAVEAHLRPVNRQCCSIQNVIFPRSVYQAENGFADYPLGYGSDMVTWTRFSRRGGWRTVPEALVFGRVSSLAISGNYVLALRRSNDRILTAGRVFHDWRTTCAEAGARIPDKLWLGMLVDYFRPSGRSTSRQERKLIRRALHEIWPESPTMVNRWYWGYFSAPAEQLWLWRSRLHRLRAWIRKS
jgi:hypothetical protein